MAKTGKKKKNGFFGVTSRMLMTVAAALLVLSYISIVVNPARLWWFSLLGLLFVLFSFGNFALLIWAAFRRSGAWVIPFIALLPAFFFIGRYVQVSSDVADVAEDPTLKIVSYNVGRFALHDKEAGLEDGSQCADSIFAFIRRQDPDIVCLQEFRISDIDKVRSYLRTQMKGYRAEFYLFPMAGGSAFGNVTLSRLPVKDKGRIKFDQSANLAIYTDYEVEGRRFRVYNCHFESYNISLPGLIRGVFKADKDVVSDTGTKMKRSITRRPKQVDQVFSDIENCPLEAFVCGDFNDNPMSYSYFRMMRGRKDTFREAGKGFGATYARLWPLLRIDYIMIQDRFRALEHHSPRVEFSDHYPVISTIEL